MISPEAFQKIEPETEILSVNLTQEKIKNSPDITTDKPVSQQQEELIRGYYSWPGYYGNGMYGRMGLGMWGYPIVEVRETEKETMEKGTTEDTIDKPYLRSTQEVTGYTIHAIDGEIGKVQDFIIDDITWKILYIIVETGNWFSGKKVVISPHWIKEVKWQEQKVTINHSKDNVKNSPAYDSLKEINDSYELLLNNYYEKML